MFNINEIIPEEFCLKCDGCCRFAEANSVWFPHLLKAEEKIIPKGKFRLVINKKGHNFICSFLNVRDNKCKIYGIRPFECCLYPFLLNCDAESGKIFLAVDINCTFVKENLKKPEFKKYTKYLTTLFNSLDFSELMKNNPQIIQSYPDVLNLAELTHETQ